VYSQLSSRRAHGLFQNATERGQISHAPNFNSPSIFFNNPDVTPILHELVMLSALPVAGIENDFSVDSTGFRTTTFNAYNGMKHGQKKEHQWVKAHLCAGVKTNIVAAVAITDSNGGDSAQVNELLAKIVAYNLTVVIHEMYENGINPDFLQIKSNACKLSPSF